MIQSCHCVFNMPLKQLHPAVQKFRFRVLLIGRSRPFPFTTCQSEALPSWLRYKRELQPDYQVVAERTSQESLVVRTTQTLHARFIFPAND